MSDVVEKAAEAAAKILELQKARTDYEASANAHEEQARADRRAMADCKRQIAEWTAALNSLQVRRSVESAQAAAKKAEESAAAHEKKAADTLADVERMRAELNELLAKAKTEQ